MAEVLLDAISQVSEVPTEFDRESGDRRNRNLKGRGEKYPTLRAIQLRTRMSIRTFSSRLGGHNAYSLANANELTSRAWCKYCTCPMVIRSMIN